MKISIVGLGKVGTTVAYTIVTQGLADELNLDSRTTSHTLGEMYDLQHMLPFLQKPVKITAGQTTNADIIVMCASVPMQNLTDRNQLLEANAELFAQLIPKLAEHNPNAIFLIVSNPVDILTHLTLKYSGFPLTKVVGISTLIDSARFRMLLAETIQVHPDDLRAYIIGEHGKHQIPVSSTITIGGEQYTDQDVIERCFQETLKAGFKVFDLKGYTSNAIAQSTCYVIKAIIDNSRKTIPLSVSIDGYLGIDNVCMSLPVVIGKQGVTKVLHPTLTDFERAQLVLISMILKQQIQKVFPVDKI